MTARTRRLTTLLMPWPVVTLLVQRPDADRLMATITLVLGVLWIAMAVALVVTLLERRNRSTAPASRIDVLTATGASMMLGGTLAIAASAVVGWASLAVVGTLGICTVMIAVIWSIIVAGGDRPWRTAKITRQILPAQSTEGDLLREQLELEGVTIPIGMRLFARGRAMRHGKLSRYVVESEASGGHVVLHGELGPALRGDYHAPPMSLWLGDVLGLTRTPVFDHGEAAFTVVPRIRSVDGLDRLFGPGGDDALSTPSTQRPTEGTFRIREYVPGDDTRRIHWVRSLQQNQLVVRLPDEIPPAEPAVRVILDNELRGTESLTTRAPGELLDGLVRVWLGIGKALADNGTRVTLVTAIGNDLAAASTERAMHARGLQPCARFGATVTWQAAVPLARLVDDRTQRGVKQIIVSSRPRRVQFATEISWVVVPEIAWTSAEPDLAKRSASILPFPLGSEENRESRRDRERQRVMAMWNDRAEFSQTMCWTEWSTYSGSHVANPKLDRIALKVIR